MSSAEQQVYDESAESYFPNYSNSTRKTLFEFIETLANFDQFYYSKIELVMCILAIFINLFHGLVLAQKSMRTTSTNVVLLGLSVIDVLSMTMEIKDDYDLLFRYDELYGSCAEPSSYFKIITSQIHMLGIDFFRRFSTYLSLSLVTIRAYAISNLLNPRYNFLTNPKTGWIAIVVNAFVCGLLCIPLVLSYDTKSTPWVPPIGCEDKYPKGFNKLEYFYVSTPWMILDMFSVQTMLYAVLAKHVPVVLFIVMTLMLIRAIRKSKQDQEKSGRSRQDSADKTSKLVLFTTISVIVAELPIGLLYVLQSFSEGVYGLIVISEQLIKFWLLIYVLNTTSHFVICYKLSSQYRKACRKLLCLEPVKKVSISSRIPKPSVISVKSVAVTVDR